VRILRALKHPNIIDIYQFYKQEKTHYYVVMEYMKGGEVQFNNFNYHFNFVKTKILTSASYRELASWVYCAVFVCNSFVAH
jgi:serine/threonine protein kinase